MSIVLNDTIHAGVGSSLNKDQNDAGLGDLSKIVPTTPLTLTLSTVSCSFDAQFKAEEMGPRFKATPEVPMIKSNFAITILEGYTPPVNTKVLKPKKVRKNAPHKKERKRPGNGLCMNSCVSFIVLSKVIPNKHYDIKHFHTGKIQIPGCIRSDLSDVRDAIETLLNYEKEYFPDIKLREDLYINMINYKFEAYKGYGVDLTKILKILEDEQAAQSSSTPDKPLEYEHPPIRKIKYTPGDSMMYIYFETPTAKNADKCIVISISHNGKCNIQGGTSNTDLTNQIYEFMLSILRKPEVYVKAASPDEE